jgi:hypothetical protein
MRIIIKKVWSNKWYYPKATIVQYQFMGKWYNCLPTNSYKNYCYRLKLTIK